MLAKSPWWLVAGVFLVLCVSSGFGFYNLSVYMNALVQARSFAVADVSGAVALLFVVSGVGGIVVGRVIERHDVRWVMLFGAALGGLALALIGLAEEMWQVWLLYALFGAGNSGVSLVPGTTVVTRWFPGANRSLAISVASTGLSTGGLLLTPLSASAIHALGIEAAMPWFGAVYFAAIAPIALALVRSWPVGGPLSAGRERSSSSLAEVLRMRFFVATTLAYVVILGAQVGGIAHVFNHVEGVAGRVTASLAVSTVALASIVGRLLGGVVLTAGFPIRLFTAINIGGQGLGLALLGLAPPKLALAGSALFGVTIGNLLMLQPLLLVQAFGAPRYPRVFATANAASTLGVAGGPLAMGIVHDLSGYAASFAGAASISALALLAFLAAGPLPRAR